MGKKTVTETEAHLSLTGKLSAIPHLGVGGAVDLGGSWRRTTERADDALAAVLETVAPEQLTRELEAGPDLDALFARAISSAAHTAYAAKRRMLGLVVTRAVLDDAVTDESALLVDAVQHLEAAHARCLEDVHRAFEQLRSSGELKPVVTGAEQPIHAAIQDAARRHHSRVLQQLVSLGQLDGTVKWDGYSLISGMTAFDRGVVNELHAAAGQAGEPGRGPLLGPAG